MELFAVMTCRENSQQKKFGLSYLCSTYGNGQCWWYKAVWFLTLKFSHETSVSSTLTPRQFSKLHIIRLYPVRTSVLFLVSNLMHWGKKESSNLGLIIMENEN